ncbi:MAG: tRNA pseudouridine(55) synthase TruB [Candidatus Taylorbacteria bacterium]|nr:tRNA pseudouridine(55) synthase TruB [Candidatus Taylorbacteria bacterium]
MDSGFLLIDKPAGMTSHDVIDHVRRATGVKRVGHSGTLDPFATGLLIVGVGREATKRLGELLKKDKEYVGTIALGAVSETYEKTGKITVNNGVVAPSRKEVEDAVKGFVGKIKQVPPMFSAKKFEGKRLYKLAQRGIEVKPKECDVEVHKFEILSYEWPLLSVRVECSSGTYIRSLANDLGARLCVGGYLSELRRMKIDRFSVEDALELSKLSPENWRSRLFSL